MPGLVDLQDGPVWGAPNSLQAAWLAMSDGIHLQRFHLALPRWRAAVAEETVRGMDEVWSPAALCARPQCRVSEPAAALMDAAGLTTWCQVPSVHGLDGGGSGPHPLHAAGQRVAIGLVGGDPCVPWRETVHCVTGASSWWVGYFAMLRHQGIHHRTHARGLDPIGIPLLVQAVRVVALGMAMRVVEACLRGADPPGARQTYCRVVVAAVQTEKCMPGLLDALAELRLVELVATSIPWRGRFSRFAGGSGIGQVE